MRLFIISIVVCAMLGACDDQKPVRSSGISPLPSHESSGDNRDEGNYPGSGSGSTGDPKDDVNLPTGKTGEASVTGEKKDSSASSPTASTAIKPTVVPAIVPTSQGGVPSGAGSAGQETATQEFRKIIIVPQLR